MNDEENNHVDKKREEYDESMSVNAVGKLLESINNSKTEREQEREGQPTQSEEVSSAKSEGYPEGYVPPSERPVKPVHVNRRSYEDEIPFEDKLKKIPREGMVDLDDDEEQYDEDKQSQTAEFASRKISLDTAERERRRKVLLGLDLDPPKVSPADMLPQHDISEAKYTQTQQQERHHPNTTKRAAADPFTKKKQNSSPSVFRVASFIIFIGLFSVIAFLLVQVTRLNAQLLEKEEALFASTVVVPVDEIEMQELQSEIEELTSYVAFLQSQLNELDPAQSEVHFGTDVNAPVPPQSSATLPSTTIGPTETIEYTVQSGETLGEIATKFFGSMIYYQHIMDTNGLASENVSIGQELLIVPLS